MEFEKLQNIVAEVTGRQASEITPDTRFREDLNLDSLDFIQIVMAIEDEFSIEIPDDVAADINTVGDAAEQIAQNLA